MDKVLFSNNCVLASYLSDFTHKITECCEQELTSCVIAGSVKKMYLTKIKLFSVTSVNFGFILNVTILDYRHLQKSNKSWYCIECCSTIFPLNALFNNKNFLSCCRNTDNNNMIITTLIG